MLRPRLRAPATPEDIWGPSGGSIPAPVPRTAFGGTVPVGGQHPCGTLRRPYGPPSAGQFHPLRGTLFPRLRSGTRRTCVCAAVVHRLPVGQGQTWWRSHQGTHTVQRSAEEPRERGCWNECFALVCVSFSGEPGWPAISNGNRVRARRPLTFKYFWIW